MSIEQQITDLRETVNRIWEVIQHYPGAFGMASNLNKKGIKPRFKKRITVDEIEQSIEKCWNAKHPNFPYIKK